jgi:two-component system LytT family response regulator
MITAVIIDDEEISLQALGEKIKKHCPDIRILKLFSKPDNALKEMPDLKPDVVFLDIEMPKINGFTFLKKLSPVNFEVIFTTAYSEYAIEALRISALDFLLKPIDVKQLAYAYDRLKERLKNKIHHLEFIDQQIQLFLQYNHPSTQIGKIALPALNGLEFVNVNDIIRIHGENVYSVYFLVNGNKIVATITLKETESMLSRHGFFRVHKSYIVNLNYVSRYIKGEGGTVIMTDGSEVEVSRRNKPEFLKRIAT